MLARRRRARAFAPGSRQPISTHEASSRRRDPHRAAASHDDRRHDHAGRDEARRDRERAAGSSPPAIAIAEVRRAPDDVDGPEGRPHLRRGGSPDERQRRADAEQADAERARPRDRDLVDAEQPEPVDHGAHHELARDQDPDRRRRADPRLRERDREDDRAAPSARRPTSTAARGRRRRARRCPAARRAGSRPTSTSWTHGRERQRLDARRSAPPNRPITAT